MLKSVGLCKTGYSIVESKYATQSRNLIILGDHNATVIPSLLLLSDTAVQMFYVNSTLDVRKYARKPLQVMYVPGYVTFSSVYYVEGLGHNLFSVGQICDADLKVAFPKNTCFIRNLEASKGLRDGLWNLRLSHLNFGTLNKQAKDGLARGIPRLKFQKDNLCSACALGKSKKSSHQPKAEETNQEKLHLVHMDLCGPMRVANNGTEFVNQILHEFYENVGISHQTSVARTPQQNDVVERRNQTLVEAARTIARKESNSGPRSKTLYSTTVVLELLKSQNAFNDLLKSYSQLEKHCIFQKDESCNNQNALEIPNFFKNNDLKAQLQDKGSTIYKLKDIIKSMREKSKEENVNYDYGEIETKNVELENSVAKLISGNERLCNEINHVKRVFLKQFNSIKKTRVRTKEQSDSLIDKLNLKSAKN
ncbi:retrovirus-related pol polyprotein from transposon TNT 1-94 [Tanacetum coccineum]